MSLQHAGLAQGRWLHLTFVEQMANIGSEVERSLNWRTKNNLPYAEKAFERALELMDLTLGDARNLKRLRELARVREAFADFFLGSNQSGSTDVSWRKYFACFTYAARKDR